MILVGSWGEGVSSKTQLTSRIFILNVAWMEFEGRCSKSGCFCGGESWGKEGKGSEIGGWVSNGSR